MATRAEETAVAIRRAMIQYEKSVLREQYFDQTTQTFQYPYAISASEVLRLAGVRSRATLSAEYHKGLKRELLNFIIVLKSKAGKGKTAKNAPQTKQSREDRIEQLAQTIAALEYKIISLEQENAALRATNLQTGEIVRLKPDKGGRKR